MVDTTIETASDVPLAFVAVNVIVYVFPAVNPVIWYEDKAPENVPDTVVPDVGTALKLYVVTVWGGAVNEMVVATDVVPDATKSVGISGTNVVVPVVVAALDVPDKLLAVIENVYVLLNVKPNKLAGDVPVYFNDNDVPPPDGTAVIL